MMRGSDVITFSGLKEEERDKIQKLRTREICIIWTVCKIFKNILFLQIM